MRLCNKNMLSKNFIYLMVVVFVTTTVNAQTTNKNFVSTTQLKQPGIKTAAAVNNVAIQSKVTKIEYLDGLGRSEQTVLVNAKEIGVDVILPKRYDDLGRVVKEYLAYAIPVTVTGEFRPNWEGEQLSFYQNNNPATLPNDLPDSHPFSINEYDLSPLNRVIKTFAPGDAWAGTQFTSGEVSVKNEFKIYDPSTGDDVKTWELNYSASPVVPVISSSYTYQLGDLIKTKTTDEHGKQVIEYKDKSGNTILKKVQLDDILTSDPHQGWLCTYYVYDNLNRLRYVIPPRATAYLHNPGNNWILTQSIIDELCFWYEYDDRGRLITKHAPGADPVVMVYDIRDRLIFTQDGNMKANPSSQNIINNRKWLMTMYDVLNRPIATAFYYGPYVTRQELQDAVNANFFTPQSTESILGDNFTISGKPSFVNIANLNILTVNFYDNYQNSVGNNSTAVFSGYIGPYPTGQPTASGDYPADPTQNLTVIGKLTATKAKILDPNLVANGNPYLYTINYFDKEYQTLQTKKENLLRVTAGFDYMTSVVNNQYDFTGKLLGNQEVVDPNGGNWSVVTKNELDIEGKTTRIFKTVTDPSNTTTTSEKLIVTNEYDRLGRLMKKTTGTGTICENIQDYTYNIRGWLRGVNLDYLNGNITPNNQRFFGYELGYNTLTSGGTLPNPQLNGNIGSMSWASAGKAGRDDLGIWTPSPNGAGIQRKYDYTYDNTNRLKKADFTEFKYTQWINSEKDFSVYGKDPNGMIDYDENGNILSMNQMGVNKTNIDPIDIMSYTYFNGGYSNRLKAVHDDSPTNGSVSDLGDFTEGQTGRGGAGTGLGYSDQDYDYDENGNLLNDRNKALIPNQTSSRSAVKYNYLNLPEHIYASINLGDVYGDNKGEIIYSYDALGNKYRKTVIDNTTTPNPTTTITNYVNGFTFGEIFNGGRLNQIATEEGRVRLATQFNNLLAYVYDWFVKDHLGNTRMVLTEEQTPSPTFQYKATFENVPTEKVTKENIAKEKELFGEDVLQPTRSPLPVELQDKDPGNKKCSLLKPGSNSGKVPYKILKVNAGDKFNIGVQYYYRPEANKNNSKSLREDIFNNLLNGILGIGNGAIGSDKAGNIIQQNATSSPYSNNNALQQFTQTDQDQQTPDHRPRAYLNYVMLDTAMQFIKGGALRVGEMDAKEPEWKNLVQNDIEATKAGYFLVYISNEEQPTANLNAGNVYFDNLVIVTNEGPIMEENHYYPFGLLIHPLSTSGSGRLKNNCKFQGQEFEHEEFSDGSGLEMYGFKYRMHDPQIGRFWQIDPLSDEYVYNSTYAFSENKVTNHIELEGLESVSLGDPMGYLAAGFRSMAGAAGTILDKINPFHGGEIHDNLEQKTSFKIKTASGDTFESSATATMAEKSTSVKIGSFYEFFYNGKNPFEFNYTNTVGMSKFEQKNTVTTYKRGVPIEISQKTTITGMSVTESVGAKVSTGDLLDKAKGDIGAELFYGWPTSIGTNRSAGLKVSADATVPVKSIDFIKTPNIQFGTTTQNKIGGSFILGWDFK
jgi:RHS repeat-associated protein